MYNDDPLYGVLECPLLVSLSIRAAARRARERASVSARREAERAHARYLRRKRAAPESRAAVWLFHQADKRRRAAIDAEARAEERRLPPPTSPAGGRQEAAQRARQLARAQLERSPRPREASRRAIQRGGFALLRARQESIHIRSGWSPRVVGAVSQAYSLQITSN